MEDEEEEEEGFVFRSGSEAGSREDQREMSQRN